LTRINDIIGYLNPGKKHITYCSRLHKWDKCVPQPKLQHPQASSSGGHQQQEVTHIELHFVDGGLFNNIGTLSLLRRKCSTIILCYATISDVLEVAKPEKLHADYDDCLLCLERASLKYQSGPQRKDTRTVST